MEVDISTISKNRIKGSFMKFSAISWKYIWPVEEKYVDLQ